MLNNKSGKVDIQADSGCDLLDEHLQTCSQHPELSSLLNNHWLLYNSLFHSSVVGNCSSISDVVLADF